MLHLHSSHTKTTPLPTITTTSGGARLRGAVASSGHKVAPPLTTTAAVHFRPNLRTKQAEQAEVVRSLEGWATSHMLPLLKPVEESWQPQEFLPEAWRPLDEFRDEVRGIQERAAELSDDYFVVLVGDMITEDAVPTYLSLLTNTHGFGPAPGADPSPWATWSRRWAAEENRHGDLLRSYLYLSGRVDMVAVERTVQYLIGAGMDGGLERSPYSTLIYTSFQERATAISHGNTARLATLSGDTLLARICGSITADEKRHEKAYCSAVAKILDIDPTGALLSLEDMMRKKITMPPYLMYDGQDPEIFEHYSEVAQRMGVYTARDYADIVEHLVGIWRLEELEGLTSEGRAAQEYVCGLAARVRRLFGRSEERAMKKVDPCLVKFSWIFNKEVSTTT